MPSYKDTDFVQVLPTASTVSVSAEDGVKFKMNNPNGKLLHPGDKPLLLLYGTFGTAVVKVKVLAPNGTFYDIAGETIDGVRLYELPVNSSAIFAIDYTAGGGSSLGACVFNGYHA